MKFVIITVAWILASISLGKTNDVETNGIDPFVSITNFINTAIQPNYDYTISIQWIDDSPWLSAVSKKHYNDRLYNAAHISIIPIQVDIVREIEATARAEILKNIGEYATNLVAEIESKYKEIK